MREGVGVEGFRFRKQLDVFMLTEGEGPVLASASAPGTDHSERAS